MPREVAEYEVRRREKLRAQYPARPFSGFQGVDSTVQLERYPIEDLAVRWIQAHDPIWQVQELRRINQCPSPGPSDVLLTPRQAVVYGAVVASPDTAFVTFRPDWFPFRDRIAEAQDGRLPRIAVLRRESSGWRILSLESLLEGTGGVSVGDCRSRPPN